MLNIFTVALGSVIIFSALASGESEKPNIILVMADDQGYGDVGFNGHPFVKTPNLDAMAKRSVVFDRFYAAAPVCSPTRASVMTGRNPMRVNVPNHGHYMRPHEHTLGELMKESGYVTGHFGKWHIGSVQPDSPTSPGQVGFDEWESALNFYDIDPYFAKNGKYVQKLGQGSVISMDSTIEFIKKHKDGDKPMFAMMWFPSPHDPHKEVPVDFPGAKDLYSDQKHLRGYFLEITLLDQQVGKLRKALQELELADNTIVWYCSDNGGLDVRSSGGRAKKGSIYEGGLRVPSLVEWPAKWKAQKLTLPATTSDIYPTLRSIVGAKPSAMALDGIDLLPAIEGKKITRSGLGFWHGYIGGQSTWSDRIIKQLMEAQQAGEKTPLPERLLKNVNSFPTLRKGDYNGHAAWNQWPWKLHRIQKGEKVVTELYHLADDPMENNNVAEQKPDLTAKMLSELEAWQGQVFDSWMGKDYELK